MSPAVFAEYREFPVPISEALSVLAARHHAFASFFYERGIKLRVIAADDPLASQVKTACATMTHIYLNEVFFSGLTIHERVGVIIHEIAHCMSGHPAMFKYWHDTGYVLNEDGTKQLQVALEVMNIAADACINLWITDAKLTLPKDRVNLSWVTPDMSTLNVYERLLTQSPPPPKGGGKPGEDDAGEGEGEGEGDGQGTKLPCGGTLVPGSAGRGQHAMAGKPETEGEATARKQAVESAIAAGTAAGTLPGSMKQALTGLLVSKVKWQDELRDAIITCAGNDMLNHRRMNRRRFLLTTEVASTRRSERVGTIFFLFDTSGSVSKFIRQFMSEVASVCEELEPKEIVVMWVDTRVAHVDVLEDADKADVEKLTVHGGGGTDLCKGFDYVAEKGPQGDQTHEECIAMVILTDSETPWPDADPGYPVICATTNPGREHPGFFRIVSLK